MKLWNEATGAWEPSRPPRTADELPQEVRDFERRWSLPWWVNPLIIITVFGFLVWVNSR